MRFWPHCIVVITVAIGLLFPHQTVALLTETKQIFLAYIGWFILLICTGFLLLCIYLATSRHGLLVLGGEDETPRYSLLSWFAMLFAAGMGAGLIFWGTAEPLTHFIQPPPGNDITPLSSEAARRAMVITHLHWALHPWAIYAVSALTVAYFTFRHQQPMLPSGPMRSGKLLMRWPWLAHLIDGIAILAVVFGIVSSLGQGVLNISGGLQQIGFLSAITPWHMLIILAVIALCYLISASTDLGKGIKLLSDFNIILCILLMLFLLVVGPSTYMLDTFIGSIGDYLGALPELSLRTRHYSDNSAWTEGWTLTYLLWWIAWGPFVGVFIARISRGRTIREFITGVVLVPSVFSMLWFSIFGGAGLSLAMESGVPIAQHALDSPTSVTYTLLSYFPWSDATQIVTLLLMFVFLVTSADSGSYVLGMFACDGNTTPPRWQRLFWGILIAALTAGALLTGGGTDMMKTVAVAGAIPFVFILLWQVGALLQSLHRYKRQ